jgi:peptidoglycan biosynthesis protein MviN/MurJ (putative lipid II flippase)
VSWLTYADRLMEFPTALLGVALGVVLIPQLSAAQAQGRGRAIRACSIGACGSCCCWPALRGGACCVFPTG